MPARRGEIYWVELDPVKGSEQGGLRPALIVQNDVGNRHSTTTVVAAITRTLPPQPYPFVVVIKPQQSGLPERSAINCAQLATIQQTGPRRVCGHRAGSRSYDPSGSLAQRRWPKWTRH